MNIKEQSELNNKIINCLYSHFKDTPKKLKIVCDWDEVIQATEPYAMYLSNIKQSEQNNPFGIKHNRMSFDFVFKLFWNSEEVEKFKIDYSSYGSKLKNADENQVEIKNSPDFYQQAPFLTIAKELLKLIKEDKVEQLIFLSAYDMGKFRDGDKRKHDIFKETFGKFSNCSLELVGFMTDGLGGSDVQISKKDWIKKHAPNFDLVIEDNPNICRSILNEQSFGLCRDCRKEKQKNCAKCPKEFSVVCSPYYPAVENQHDERVLLVKQEVSDLKKEDFNERR